MNITSEKTYDFVVVGSGISGLTAALLLSKLGKEVLLIEKFGTIGGSLGRFYKSNFPIDTGFHFTSGLKSDDVFAKMLKVLDIDKQIIPIFMDDDSSNQLIFENTASLYKFPSGIENVKKYLINCFPNEHSAINQYFNKIEDFHKETVLINPNKLAEIKRSDSDYITLAEYLDTITRDIRLKSVLTSYMMTYGARPSAISLADHCRTVSGFYTSVARIKDGGDSFIKGFKEQFKKYKVTIWTNSYIKTIGKLNNRNVEEVTLNNGRIVKAKNFIFTIHPDELLNIIPEKYLSNAFISRVKDFESSIGFLAVHSVIINRSVNLPYNAIITIYPNDNIESFFENSLNPDGVLIIIKSEETDKNGEKVQMLNILETTPVKNYKKWSDCSQDGRNEEYYSFKKAKTERILERVYNVFPELKNNLNILAVGTPLTFKDYLNSPNGEAYGIEQSCGQFNLFGKLPIKNFLCCGQSSMLPGVIGAMISSFVLVSGIVGKDEIATLFKP